AIGGFFDVLTPEWLFEIPEQGQTTPAAHICKFRFGQLVRIVILCMSGAEGKPRHQDCEDQAWHVHENHLQGLLVCPEQWMPDSFFCSHRQLMGLQKTRQTPGAAAK